MKDLWDKSYPLRQKIVRCLKEVGRRGFDEAGVASVSVRVGEKGEFLFCSNSYFVERASPEAVGIHNSVGDRVEAGQMLGDDVTLHRGIYGARKDARAILMAQPVYATTYAAMGRVPNAGVTQETLLGLDDVSLSAYTNRQHRHFSPL